MLKNPRKLFIILLCHKNRDTGQIPRRIPYESAYPKSKKVPENSVGPVMPSDVPMTE